MKSKIVATIAVLLLLSSTSCKKDFNCRCQYKAAGVPLIQNYPLQNTTLQDANQTCDGTEASMSSLPYYSDVNCEITE